MIQRPVPRVNTGRRIILTTFGSLGDLHPYIAIARGLQSRGHEPIIATSNYYRQKIEALGIGFRPVRPDAPEPDANPEFMRRIMDRRKGSEYVIRDVMMAVLRQSYDDTLVATQGADLLVSHALTYTTRLVAERKRIPWVSTVLSPILFFSAHDPPVPAPAPYLAKLRFLGPAFHRALYWLGKRSIRAWCEPWHRLRAEIGLPKIDESPLFEAQHSPGLVLALFSKVLAERQPDWPAHTEQTGFPFYDEDGAAGMSPELASFLDAGPPPIVFTLGSSAVMDAGRFYEHSIAAARTLHRRAVLLVGSDPRNRPASLSEDMIAVGYAAFAELFPRAAAIVHQGGIGTTAQAMRSGRPMLVMPYAHDQPDNAARVTRLGIARTIVRDRYTPRSAARALHPLLEEPSYARRAAQVGAQVRGEDSIAAACAAITSFLDTMPRAAASSAR
jgi:UDP:flavonoid glycosyltransferase YjiC (YdhE family)